jgi:hypothetical protein
MAESTKGQTSSQRLGYARWGVKSIGQVRYVSSTGSEERESAGSTLIVCCRPCSLSQQTVTASRDDRQMICNRPVMRTSRELIMIVIRPRIRRRVPVGWASLSSP